jgi:hypothetical protein
MIVLNDSALQSIRDNRALKKAIINQLDCTEKTLYLDLKNNSTKLTQLAIVNLIVEHTNRPLSELITGGKLSKLIAR